MDSCPKSDKEPLMSKGKKTHFFKIILDGNIRDGKLRTGIAARKGGVSWWTSFAKENSLQVGDVCIFEL
ncbi:conserved hypothetical protein, partial [Ricinus communis]